MADDFLEEARTVRANQKLAAARERRERLVGDAENVLYDYAHGTLLGPATPEQVAASDAAAEKDGGRGAILIDADGVVVHEGSYDAQRPGVRTVYTRPNTERGN